MIKRTPIVAAFTLAFIATTACGAINAAAQEAAPRQQNETAPPPMAGPERDGQLSRGPRVDAKAALRLSPEQEKLWGPVEDAVRTLQERMRTFSSMSGDDQAGDQMSHLRRIAELSTQHGTALTALANAVQPLWQTLDDDQKQELTRFIGAAWQNGENRRTARGSNPDDNPGMDRRRYGGEQRDDRRNRMMRHGEDPNDQPGMERRPYGGEQRDDRRNRMMGQEEGPNDQPGMDRRRYGERDRAFDGYGRRESDQRHEQRDNRRGDRFDGYARRDWQDDDSRPRDFYRDRHALDRRSDNRRSCEDRE